MEIRGRRDKGEQRPERLPRQVHLKPDQWGSVPETARLWHEYNASPQERGVREKVLRQIVPILIDIISDELTARQRQVMELYFLEQQTEVAVAERLGITQPTVSQHLYGKMRGGKKVGGALGRIRKRLLARAAKKDWHPGTNEVLGLVVGLLEQGITRRKAADLLSSFEQ
jgi:DNA-directed RNA polymerase specialized sigma24 family protein